MKKLLVILFLLCSTNVFSDWKITQYYGSASGIMLKNEWITKECPYSFSFTTSDYMICKFTDSKTKKRVVISPPFSIEEL